MQDHVRSVATSLLSSASTSSQSRSACGPQSLEAHVISSEEEPSADEAFDPFTSRCSGPPIKCRHGAGMRELVDGFGLCSPGRWRPLQRGRLCSGSELQHALSVQEALRTFVTTELGDLKKAAFALASGHLKTSPFSESSLGRLRNTLARMLPDPELAGERTAGQPFWLHLLHQSLVILGDPDASILVDGDCSFAEGVHLGDEFPIARTPQVYHKRTSFRTLDVTEFVPDMDNYSSAELSADQLEGQFRRDELAGLMMPTTEAAVEAEFGPGRLWLQRWGLWPNPMARLGPFMTQRMGLGSTIRSGSWTSSKCPGQMNCLKSQPSGVTLGRRYSLSPRTSPRRTGG